MNGGDSATGEANLFVLNGLKFLVVFKKGNRKGRKDLRKVRKEFICIELFLSSQKHKLSHEIQSIYFY